MTWLKLDVSFPENPKVLEAGDSAAWLYVCGLAWSVRHEQDGKIPGWIVPRLTGLNDWKQAAEALVRVVLWHRVGDDFLIHDFDKHQRTKADIDRAREQARNRAARSREVRAYVDEVRADLRGDSARKPEQKERSAFARTPSCSCGQPLLVDALECPWCETPYAKSNLPQLAVLSDRSAS